MADIGLTVRQGEASQAGVLVTAPTRRIAALVQRQRGIPFKAVRVFSPQEDIKRFGKRLSGAYSYQVIQHLYSEVGGYGADITEVRVLDELNSSAARGDLFEGTLSGQTFVKVINVNGVLGLTSRSETYSWSNFVVGDRIRLTIGSSNFDYVVTPGNQQVDVSAGIRNAITAAQGLGNVDALLVTPSLTGSNLLIVGAVTSRTTVSVDDYNPATVTINLTASTLVTGTRIRITGSPDITDQAGNLVPNPYVVSKGNNAYELYVDSGLTQPCKVAVASPVPTYTITWGGLFTTSSVILPGAATRVATIWAGQLGEKDPGTWANYTSSTGVRVRMIPPGNPLGRTGEYVFEVYYEGKRVEQFSDANLTTLFGKVNNQSYYVMVEPDNITAVTRVTTVDLNGGTYSAPTEAMYYPIADDLDPKGLAVLDKEKVQLIICPDLTATTATMSLELISYCSARENVNAYMHYADGLNDQQVRAISLAIQTTDVSRRHLGMFRFWNKVNDESGNAEWLPGYGASVGAFIKTQASNADRPWTPPAGTTGIFTSVLDVSPKYDPSQKPRLNMNVKEYLANVVVYEEGVGYYLISSRTMSSKELYHSLSVSFHTNYVMATLQNNYAKATQKNNTPEWADTLILELTEFFRTQYNDGGLERTVPFSTAFKVISDLSNNPRTQSRKIRNFDLLWIPVECLESVVFNLSRNDGALLINQTN